MLWNAGKQRKMEKTAKAFAALPAILHLTPGKVDGVEMCPGRSAGCSAACLNTAGMGGMNCVQRARLAKTRAFLADPKAFAETLTREARMLIRRAEKRALTPVLRPNGTSDISWEQLLPSDVLEWCYDYTKRADRWRAQGYHLTLSWHEEMGASPMDLAREARKARRPGVAIVVSPALHAKLVARKTYHGIPIVDGTVHDYRPSDPSGALVVLLPLGRAKRDKLGFVVSDESQLWQAGPRHAKRRALPVVSVC
jgi:hypothetical protein